MLELDGLSVNYGAVVAVRDVSFQVASHGAVGILGPNGAGKTSTLRAISGVASHRGKVLLDGRDISSLSPRDIARAGIIHVPEGRRVFGSLSVEENLLVGATAGKGRPARFSTSDVYDLLPAMGRLRNRSAWALSGGEQQMLAVGRALVASPSFLLLDEPSLGLAPALADRIYETFQTLKGSIGLLVVEQTASRALELVDQVVVLRDGHLVGQGTPEDFADADQLADLLLGVY